MTLPNEQSEIVVGQVDREAAADIYGAFRDHDFAGWIRQGTNAGGDHNFVIQRIARHRIEALARASAPAGEVERLEHVIDRDRYTAAACVNAVDRVLQSRKWLREAGRGSYAYDDERYQEEFGLAFDEITEALAPMRALAADKSDCTTDPAKVITAREAGAEKFAMLAAAPPTPAPQAGVEEARRAERAAHRQAVEAAHQLTSVMPTLLAREAEDDAEIERILAMTEEEILATSTPEEIRKARLFQANIRSALRQASTQGADKGGKGGVGAVCGGSRRLP